MADLPDFSRYCETACRRFWGEPTRETRTQLRWNGNNGYDGTSFARDKRVWYDRGAGIGGGTIQLIQSETGLEDFAAAWQWGYDNGLIAEPPEATNSASDRIVATYDYVDEAGEVLFQVVRFEPKKFRQRRQADNGEWKWEVKGVRRVPYRLPDVIEAIALEHPVYVTEGEKDADRLAHFGLAATTNAGGAGKWHSDLTSFLIGADVIVIGDNDDVGRQHAQTICRALLPVAARVRRLDIAGFWPKCPPKGDISDWLSNSGGSLDALLAALGQVADFSAFAPVAPVAPVVLGETDAGIDGAAIKPRGWLLGNVFCRGFISSLIAEGGTGKTAVRYTQLVSLATGRELTGDHVFQRCRALIVSLEDGIDELRRRISAILLHYAIPRAELAGWLYLAAPSAALGRLMVVDPKTHRPEISGLAAALEATIMARKLDLVMLDPFVKTHGLEENDNSGMDAVMQLMADIATRHDIALDVPHHTSKGVAEPGNASRSRGASAVRDGARLVYSLSAMTADEAAELGVPERDRRRYVRIDPAKVNLVAAPDAATWFHMVSVPLGNANELYPSGDAIQVIEPWRPADPFQNISTAQLRAVQQRVAQADFRDDPRSPEWAGFAVAEVLGLDALNRAHAKRIQTVLRTWTENGMFRTVLKRDAHRKMRSFMEVAEWA